MKPEAISAAANGVKVSVGGAVGGTSLWVWLSENNEAIGSVCMILGILISAAGFAYTVYQAKKGGK